MSKEAINQYLTEAMGECWHEWVPAIDKEGGAYISNAWECRCGTKASKLHLTDPLPANNDFFTWQGFGKLWEWAENELWWCRFLNSLDGPLSHYINPTNFANAIHEFLKER